jgi:hypothetical protein
MRTGIHPNQSTNSLRFSGTYEGITATNPDCVLKKLDKAAYKPEVDIFVSRPQQGGMNVVILPSRAYEHLHNTMVERTQKDFENHVDDYNSAHGDQIAWETSSENIPSEAEMAAQNYMPLAEALKDPDQFKAENVKFEIRPAQSSHQKPSSNTGINALQRQAHNFKSLFSRFRHMTGWNKTGKKKAK